MKKNRAQPIKFLVIGNPENRRVSFFQAALARLQCPPAITIAYQDLLTNRINLSEHLQPGTIIRIESPGENFTVEKLLIALGAAQAAENTQQDHCDLISAESAQLLDFDNGRISYIRQWYYGFNALLMRLAEQLQQREQIYCLNNPLDIAIMFDKPRCHQLLQQHGISVPRSLGIVQSFDQLFEKMRAQRCWRVFIKLAHGSSASGVIAYQTNQREHKAVTTVEMIRVGNEIKLYNSLRLREYRDWREIQDLIDSLARHYIWVEEWLPKASFDGKSFDLRVVVIGGQARHTVMRTSNSPITNLHLLNQRGDLERLMASINSADWQAMMRTCESAMKIFSCHYAGIDLLVRKDLRRSAILEVNAFGDLLPNLYYDGLDTYTSEIQTFLEQI